MSAPRLSIGTFGDIGFVRTDGGRTVARARYRDWDGQLRLVHATDDTAKGAERALKAKLAHRSLFQPSSSALTADSPFPDLVAYWLEDLELEDRISRRTRQLYERNMHTLVMPVFRNLALREIGVARCDQFLKQLARRSYSRAKQARVVLRLALGLAVRHEVLPRSPMDHVARLHRPPTAPNALTPAEVNAIRTAVAFWEGGRSVSGPKPDGQLGAIIEVMLGTSARIGEVLAIRRRDVDITSSVASIRIAGTVVSHRGEPTIRQDHPKTAKSRRTVAIPSFAAEAVRRRLVRLESPSLDARRVHGASIRRCRSAPATRPPRRSHATLHRCLDVRRVVRRQGLAGRLGLARNVRRRDVARGGDERFGRDTERGGPQTLEPPECGRPTLASRRFGLRHAKSAGRVNVRISAAVRHPRAWSISLLASLIPTRRRPRRPGAR